MDILFIYNIYNVGQQSLLTRSRMKSNEFASLIPGVFQGQNELAKEQQACALAIGDVMLMSVQINRSNRKYNNQKQTHTSHKQRQYLDGLGSYQSLPSFWALRKKSFWFKHLVDHCGLVNTKVQEVGQLHFQLQEALAKVVGPSVFRFSLVNGDIEKNRMVMSCVEQRCDSGNKIGV